jgi:hypothetical protein
MFAAYCECRVQCAGSAECQSLLSDSMIGDIDEPEHAQVSWAEFAPTLLLRPIAYFRLMVGALY